MELMTKIKIGVLSALVVVVLVLVFKNTDAVKVDLLFFEPTLPMFVLALICLAVGFASGMLVSTLLRMRRAKKDANAA